MAMSKRHHWLSLVLVSCCLAVSACSKKSEQSASTAPPPASNATSGFSPKPDPASNRPGSPHDPGSGEEATAIAWIGRTRMMTRKAGSERLMVAIP